MVKQSDDYSYDSITLKMWSSAVSDDLSVFDVPDSLKNEAGFKLFHDQVLIASQDVSEGLIRLAYHVHMIMEHDMWQYARDNDGIPLYRSQEEYLADLSQSTVRGFAVSTMKAFHTAFRLANQLGYRNIDDIEQRGLNIFVDISRLVQKDRATAEPIGLLKSEVDIPDIKNYLVEIIETISSSPEPLTHRDYKEYLEEKLIPDKPQIKFFINDEGGEAYISWEMTAYSNGKLEYKTGETVLNIGDMPGPVLTKLKEKILR